MNFSSTVPDRLYADRRRSRRYENRYYHRRYAGDDNTGWMNIGAAVAPDAALASIISTVTVIAGHQSIGAGIALAIPLAAAGQVLTIIVRTITVAFQHAADKAAENGNLTALSWLHVSSLFLQAMRIAIPAVIVAISVGTSEVQGLLNAIPEVVTSGLNIAGGMIVVVGYAMVINMMRAGYLMPFFYLGFVTAAFTNFNPWPWV